MRLSKVVWMGYNASSHSRAIIGFKCHKQDLVENVELNKKPVQAV